MILYASFFSSSSAGTSEKASSPFLRSASSSCAARVLVLLDLRQLLVERRDLVARRVGRRLELVQLGRQRGRLLRVGAVDALEPLLGLARALLLLHRQRLVRELELGVGDALLDLLGRQRAARRAVAQRAQLGHGLLALGLAVVDLGLQALLLELLWLLLLLLLFRA